ncbi:uncharacterized protein LOC123302961 [Chrysoperla carnea]|uniref:uncharacterized protein LOC123302961 n=1 Tax=Chrysoperla carnea TaxID=189513 RepID=UPI001D08861D|nr:uncharacterized protein LOC123302961 [Chrysoperla carnea]
MPKRRLKSLSVREKMKLISIYESGKLRDEVFKQLRNKNVPVSGPMIKETAKELARRLVLESLAQKFLSPLAASQEELKGGQMLSLNFI